MDPGDTGIFQRAELFFRQKTAGSTDRQVRFLTDSADGPAQLFYFRIFQLPAGGDDE